MNTVLHCTAVILHVLHTTAVHRTVLTAVDTIVLHGAILQYFRAAISTVHMKVYLRCTVLCTVQQRNTVYCKAVQYSMRRRRAPDGDTVQYTYLAR